MKTLDKILTALQSGNMKSGLEMLVRYASENCPDDPGLKNASINMLARFNQLTRRRIAGVIADSEMQISENQIRFLALELIDALRDEPESTEEDGRGKREDNEKAEETHRTKILFFGAEPSDQTLLNLRKEVDKIEDALYDSNLASRFKLIKSKATRPDDFLRLILKNKPEFVHFAGHGTQDGIFMLDDRGESILIPTEKLTDVFRLFREVVGCVVLNSCFSLPQAMRINDYIPHVIGCTRRVENKSAMSFASMFYTAIANGEDIPFAYDYARISTNLNDMDGENFTILSK
jgi:hypothetical protein